jgi:hypothetical protein
MVKAHSMLIQSKIYPCLLEFLDVFIVVLKWIIRVNIVLLKLLKNNQDEEVKHHRLTHHGEENEK